MSFRPSDHWKKPEGHMCWVDNDNRVQNLTLVYYRAEFIWQHLTTNWICATEIHLISTVFMGQWGNGEDHGDWNCTASQCTMYYIVACGLLTGWLAEHSCKWSDIAQCAARYIHSIAGISSQVLMHRPPPPPLPDQGHPHALQQIITVVTTVHYSTSQPQLTLDI